MRRVTKIISVSLSGALLVGVYVDARSHPSPEDATPFHARVRSLVQQVPMRIGAWDGVARPLPQAAQALLRPNAELSRQYHSAATGRDANLILVQCRDSRDMAGHYPPRCYPAHGWTPGGTTEKLTVNLDGMEIPVNRFTYDKSALGRTRRIVIYGFFVLPGRGFVTDMDDVYRAAEYYAVRPYGAAQIQVVVDGAGTVDEDLAVFRDLVTPLAPAIRELRMLPEGTRE